MRRFKTKEEVAEYTSKRMERGRSIMHNVQHVVGKIYSVSSESQSYRDYTVDLEENTCQCHDWMLANMDENGRMLPVDARSRCKHLWAAYFYSTGGKE